MLSLQLPTFSQMQFSQFSLVVYLARCLRSYPFTISSGEVGMRRKIEGRTVSSSSLVFIVTSLKTFNKFRAFIHSTETYITLAYSYLKKLYLFLPYASKVSFSRSFALSPYNNCPNFICKKLMNKHRILLFSFLICSVVFFAMLLRLVFFNYTTKKSKITN